jgi:BirA family biotin operon repressor/biotin-[acetyl-CoA-carboxylase] ligase
MSQNDLSYTLLQAMLKTRPFRYFDTVGSTNDEARQWALRGAPSGAVVVADEQTAGRGRLQRVWHTPPNQALALSLILRPAIGASNLQRLTMLSAVAVCEALALYVPSKLVGLKWPNDVLLDGQKVSGILTEALWQSEVLHGVILGIGINVRTDFAGTSLAESATALEIHTQQTVNRTTLLGQLLMAFDRWSDQLLEPALYNAWRQRLVTLGKQVRLDTAGQTLEGTAVDVDASGALLVEDHAGKKHRVLVGDVSG